jgi:tetratricopeptide (TPR) repeat protein
MKEIKRVYLPGNVFKNEHWQNPETDRGGYLSGLALDCFLHQEKDRNSHYFARELMWRGRPKSAIKEFERHLTIGWWHAERAQSMIYIGNCNLMIGKKKEAVEWFKKAFDEDSGRREALIRLAEFYYREKDWQKCACYAAASLEIGWSGYYANNKYHYEHIPHELLAEVKWYLKDKAGSKYHFDKCLEFQPYNSRFLHDYRFHYPIPKVDFIIPTLGRPEGLQRCIDSIKKLNYPQEFINIIVAEDEPRIGVPKRVKEGFEKGDGEYVVYAANDCEFSPDSLMIAYLAMKKNNKALCAFNIGDVLPDEGNICAHFIIRRDFVEDVLGEIFDTEFNHCGVDNLLWAKAKKFNQAMRSEMAKVNHYHFSNGKAEFDNIYKIGWNEESVKKDRELLKKKLEELKT